MKTHIALKISISILFFPLLFGCFKPINRVEKLYLLTEEEKTWLPYKVGDSLTFQLNDSTYYNLKVREILNRRSIFEYDDKTEYVSETKEIVLENAALDSLQHPYILIVSHYHEDINVKIIFNNISNSQSNNYNNSIFEINGNVNDSPTGNIQISNKLYRDVKFLNSKNGELLVKQGIGILKFKKTNDASFTILRK